MKMSRLKYFVVTFCIAGAGLVFAAGNEGLPSHVRSPIGSPTAVPRGRVRRLAPTYQEQLAQRQYQSARRLAQSVPEIAGGADNQEYAQMRSYLRNSSLKRFGGVNSTYLPSEFVLGDTVGSLQRSGYTSNVPRTVQRGEVVNVQPLAKPRVQQPAFTFVRTAPFAMSPEEMERQIAAQRERGTINNVTAVASYEDIVLRDRQEVLHEETDAKMSQEKADDELDSLLKTLEPDSPVEPSQPLTIEEIVENQNQTVLDKTRAEDVDLENLPEVKEKTEDDSEAEDQEEADAEAKKLEIDRGQGRKLLAEYSTYENFARAKYALFTQAASDFMAEGKYYKAADAYSLAEIYRKNNPAIHLAKATALFAAGDYLSSSLSLANAITIAPTYASRKVDLVKLIKSDEVLRSRIADLADLSTKTSSPDVAFLLAYVLYQSDDLDGAKAAIDKSMLSFSDRKTVIDLRVAIYSAIEAKSKDSN